MLLDHGDVSGVKTRVNNSQRKIVKNKTLNNFIIPLQISNTDHEFNVFLNDFRMGG